MKKQHWADLDSLRGVLALLVVLLHFGISSFAVRRFSLPPLRFELAVDVFFLLSGFVLTHSVAKRPRIGDFTFKRLFRLLPVYYATLALLLPFAAGGAIIAGTRGGSVLGWAPFRLLGYISYPLYLCHIPVLRVMQAVWPGAIDTNPAAKLAGVGGAIVLAWILAAAIERPAMKLPQSWRMRRTNQG